MADTGKLEKMLILAFSDSEKAENGGVMTLMILSKHSSILKVIRLPIS